MKKEQLLSASLFLKEYTQTECGGLWWIVKVAALDPKFNPYQGFSALDCNPVCSDNPKQIWHMVRWNGNRDVTALWNRPVRLRFNLHQASLYAFQFGGTQAD